MTTTPQTDQPEWDDANRKLHAACQQSAQSARVQIAHELSQLFRRFRQYEKEEDWVRLVMEGAGSYAREAALFAVRGEILRLRGSINLNLPEEMTFDAKTAAAFDALLHSKEAVTALRTASEVGAALSSTGRVAYLFPIANGVRIAAVLFAASEEAEVDQLDLVANMAGSALEHKGQPASQIALLPKVERPPQPPAPPPAVRRLPSWADMPADQRALHSEAARFARVTVAEIQLLKPVACRTAREKGDLYVLLAREIDRARETFRQQFMILPSMTDYLHRELVGSILDGDSKKLGTDYPGEL